MSVGFHFDMTRCTGCRACQVACQDKNRLEVGTVFRNAHSYTVGDYPDVMGYSYSYSCNHCEDPACMKKCPTGAIYKADDGTVIIDQDVCEGKQKCIKACPYSVPVLLSSGKANKCDGCYAIRQAGGVGACPNRALDFGDVNDMIAKYGSDFVNEIAVLPSADETQPNTMINAKDAAFEDGYKEIMW